MKWDLDIWIGAWADPCAANLSGYSRTPVLHKIILPTASIDHPNDATRVGLINKYGSNPKAKPLDERRTS